MKLHYLQPFIGLAAQVLASDDLANGHRGTEFTIRQRHSHASRENGHIPGQSLEVRQDVACGSGKGSCPAGQCCSETGQCGTGVQYCRSPECQMLYSNGQCDASKQPSGSSTASVPRNRAGSVPYDEYITACTVPGTVALTFDDGPYKYTEHVLDLLDQYGIKATFFITGNNLGKKPIDDESTPWPGILRRMHMAGHQLASHTWSHQDLSAVTPEIREQQVIYNEMAFRNIFGWFPKYLRPPYGTCSRDSGCLDYVTKLGYHVINWNIDTRDWANATPEKIQVSKDTFKNGLLDTSKGYISLAHDIHQQTAYNLTEFMIKTVKEKGFRAVTVAECLGDSPSNWYVAAGPNINTANTTGCTSTATSAPQGGATSPPSSTVVSPDGTCGSRSGAKYTCKGSKFGDCCSYNGYCGKSSAYCDGGCLSDFGTCNQRNPSDPPSISENGLCGQKVGQKCQGSKYGNCCSKYGYCGSTDAYCGSGCQTSFGSCS